MMNFSMACCECSTKTWISSQELFAYTAGEKYSIRKLRYCVKVVCSCTVKSRVVATLSVNYFCMKIQKNFCLQKIFRSYRSIAASPLLERRHDSRFYSNFSTVCNGQVFSLLFLFRNGIARKASSTLGPTSFNEPLQVSPWLLSSRIVTVVFFL